MPSTPSDTTDDALAPSTGATVADEHGADDDRRWRIIRQVVLVATILPVYVAAVRDGINGWYPALDAATVVVRSRDVISAHPPLVGMWASVSADLGRATYFPGAIQLYLLTVPIHVLGNTWGTLLGMATLNAAALLTAAWLAGRRLGPRAVVFAYLGLAALVWTMGSEVLVDVAPMQMVTIPFALFLVAVWSVADGDLVAVPVLAIVANFLVLDHLVFTLLVPVIGLCAPIGLLLALRRARAEHPEGWPALRRRTLQALGIALACTVVLWIPSLVQQVRNRPGNLTNLWHAGKITIHNHNTPLQALDAVVSIVAKPPFWLGNSFRNPSFGKHHIEIPGMILGGVLTLVLLGLVVLAYRRRDRTSLTILGVAIVTMVASAYNITRAPSPYGFRAQYLHSLWVMAMFTWLAVVVTVVRNVPALTRPVTARRIAGAGAAATLLVSALALPHKDPGSGTNGTSDTSMELTKQVIDPAVKALRGKGQVEVVTAGSFSNFAVASALVLALQTAGVDFCVPPGLVDQYTVRRACNPGGADVIVAVESAVYPASPTETVIVEGSLLTPAEQRELSDLTGKVAHWLAGQDSITVTPATKAYLTAHYGATQAKLRTIDSLDPHGDPLQYLALSPKFANFVSVLARTAPDGTVKAPIETGSFPEADLVRWADLVTKANNGNTVRIAIQNPTP